MADKNKTSKFWVVYWLTLFAIAMFSLGVATQSYFLMKAKTPSANVNMTSLRDLLLQEINQINIPNGTCQDYARYFNKTLTEKYPELDVHWDEYICLDDVRVCDKAHTYIVVGGHGSQCMLNSKRLDCVEFKES